MDRSRVFMLLGVLLAAALCTSQSNAQQYPVRPVTFIVSFPAGGLSDLAARAVAQGLSKRMNASFVVENRVGASGTVGAGFVARSAPDGYTLLITAPADVTNLHYMSVSYDILSDFTHIGMIFEGPPLILIVNPSLPYKSVKDLVDDARANPGKISFGSSGPASGPSLAIAQFQSMANINVVDVPYRGVVQAALGVASGEISSAFTFQNSAKPLADDGKVRALASTGAARSSSWPGLPTMNESGFPRYEFEAFVGIAAPAKTSPNIINELSQNLNATVSDPSIQAIFANFGMRPREKNSPADIAAYMKREVARIGELAKLTKK